MKFPKIKLPEIKFNLSLPRFPKLVLPQFRFPHLRLPQFKAPQLKLREAAPLAIFGVLTALVMLGVVIALRAMPAGKVEVNLPTIQLPQIVPDDIRVVRAESLNVRAEPSKSAEVVGALSRGYEVAVLDVEGEWCKIKFEGRRAFVFCKWLDPQKE